MHGNGTGEAEVRIAELVATLSYAADLGASVAEREATFYLGLLTNAYCHADAAEQASWFGDDISFKGDSFDALDMNTPQSIAFLLRKLGSHGTPLQRAKRYVAFPVTGWKQVMEFLSTHVRLGAQFAAQVGLDTATCTAISQAYEQWDGRGQPQRLRGEEISLPARLVQLASPVEVHSRRNVEAARRVARRHRGTQFDPAIVDVFDARAAELLDGLDQAAEWDALIDGQPALSRRVSGAELDAVLEGMADLVDLKAPAMAGHSRGVANLAAEAARLSGASADEVSTLRRAGLVHDLGRLGVSNSILDKPGPLSAAEFERVRLHPYLTDRMLARVTALEGSRRIAARHHERLDGSGYPHGLTAAALTPADRLLAAADSYHAMTEPRPYRAPLEPDEAAKELRAEVRAARLDGDAVNAVLTAAGHRAPRRRSWPGGLTAREVEVLVLVARGHPNKEIARRLVVTPKTVSNHVEHIYTKLGISCRPEATLFAMRHGLVGAFEPADGARTAD